MSCPICDAPTQKSVQPFCSKRCADVDLANWLGERYKVADTSSHDEFGDSEL